MRKLNAVVCISTTAVLWAGSAFAQGSSIELLDVSPARLAHLPSARSSAPIARDSELRRASRAHEFVREKMHPQGRSRIGASRAGASAGLKLQSDVAEHRQERRGATAGKAGGSGKGGRS
jgi:hypothetical protein